VQNLHGCSLKGSCPRQVLHVSSSNRGYPTVWTTQAVLYSTLTALVYFGLCSAQARPPAEYAVACSACGLLHAGKTMQPKLLGAGASRMR
jgi:hypothetical protein